MWLNNAKASLSDYTYVLYPLVNLATIVIISCRISSLYRVHNWHKPSTPWTTLITFGDNFSDSGNFAHITGGTYPSEPYYWHHRFSNGPNWIDHLIQDLGGPGQLKMRNFAHGGASTDNSVWQGSLLGHVVPGVRQQVRGFMLKSRNTGYAGADKTLYMVWTGANDCLAMGGVGASARRPTVDEVHESLFQTILQLERESHNKATQIVVLTPPPVEDSPLVRHGKSEAREEVRKAAAQMARDLPHALFQRLAKLGPVSITDSSKLAPLNPPSELPKHRRRAASPITHYITADLPHDYSHLDPHEHNGTHPVPRPLQIPLSVHKRSPPPQPHSLRPGRLQIMVYDAYNFFKHASTNPQCFGLNPAVVNEACGEQKACYDRVWADDSNINTAVQYWMARDITMRLHMWHLRNAGVNINTVFKNSTRAREIELEMLGFTCPMHAAPTKF
ncbi:hypothetical protein GGI05_005264 [Coemansia sp. RSA 2603]|nr:hypothetical protein GGI05_005264 [Coemansia sp. RSA 2603]